MGTCECENPTDSENEVNAQEEDMQTLNKNNNKEYNPKTLNNNYMNTDINREKHNQFKDNNPARNPDLTENENLNNREFEEEDKKEGVEGIEELRARYENGKIRNNENKEKFQLNNNNSNKEQILFNISTVEQNDDFSKYIFDGINNIRENPQSFIPKIEDAKKNIVYSKKGLCIYKSSVKVALSKGIPAFDEAIDYLNNLTPMKKLLFSSELLIPPPQTEEQIKDKTYMYEIINQKVQNGIPIKSFWKDIIKDRETCLLLMIVDDTGPNSGKKRNDILDPTMQYIGIISKKIGKSFASFVTIC